MQNSRVVAIMHDFRLATHTARERRVYFKINTILTATTLCLVSCITLSCGSSNRKDEKAKGDLLRNYDNEFIKLLATANGQIGKGILTYESIAPNLLPKRIVVKGSHYELGYLTGLIAKGYFGDAMKKEMALKPEAAEINQQIIEMYRSVCPSYLEQVKGVAAAYDLSIKDVDLRYMEHWFFTLLWWRLFEYEQFEIVTDYYHPSKSIFDFSRCSLVSYYDEKHRSQRIGRNFDVSSDRPHFVVTAELEGTYRTIGNTCYMLYHWVEDGFNERGLYVGVATNGHPSKYNQKEHEYPDQPAIQVIHMARIVLDTCASVDEALKLIGSVRIWFPVEVNHLLITDATGKAAVVEFDLDRQMVVFHKKEPYMILTNTAYQEGIPYVRDNCRRYRKAEDMLKSGLDNSEKLFAVMQAMQLKTGNSRTLWTSITDLAKQQMDVRFRSEGFSVPHVFHLGP